MKKEKEKEEEEEEEDRNKIKNMIDNKTKLKILSSSFYPNIFEKVDNRSEQKNILNANILLNWGFLRLSNRRG